MADPALAGYRPGPWPCEDGGPRRTQTSAAAQGLSIRPGERLQLQQRSAPVGCMTVTRDPGEVYLLGHTGSGNSTTSWVERIDPESLATLVRSPALAAGPFWPGGIAAHANGSLYVTYGRWCHRLDADCQPLASRELPRDRPYNSLLVLPDGMLVMKDFAGGRGLHALPEGTGSELVVLEPERLKVVARLELAEGSIARLSADVAEDGSASVYVVGDESLMWVRWDGSKLALDEGWTSRYLRFEGQTFGWDVVIEDGYAWFLDNGEGTTAFGPSFRGKGASAAPLHLVRMPLDAKRPEPEYAEVCGRPGGIIANPPLVDASRKIVIGYDSGNGIVTAWRYETGSLEKAWQRAQDQAGHMMLFPEPGLMLSYDFDHDAGAENVVVLDIESGEERARVTLASPLQCVVFPSAGWGRDVYVNTFTTVARLYVE